MSDNASDIFFDVKDGVGRVTLNRPSALNAVTLEMLKALDERLIAWERDPSIGCVVVSGEGRAFAAGGDIRRLYDAGRTGDDYTQTFFRDEYVTNWRIFHYSKPYVAIMDGVTMGGGVGLSVHGSHRVVTENTIFAMPETGIGFFPDVGGTYFLPRLPGRIGLYMALTGARLRAADCLFAGIATHHVPVARIPDLERALGDATLTAEEAHRQVTEILDAFSEGPGESQVETIRGRIDELFGADDVEEIAVALRARTDEWSKKTLEGMIARSPTALKVACEQFRRGRSLDLDAALVLEYRMSQEFMRNADFYEGVRATILDKDGSPVWRPPRLEEVSAAAVSAYFQPPPTGDLRFDAAR